MMILKSILGVFAFVLACFTVSHGVQLCRVCFPDPLPLVVSDLCKLGMLCGAARVVWSCQLVPLVVCFRRVVSHAIRSRRAACADGLTVCRFRSGIGSGRGVWSGVGGGSGSVSEVITAGRQKNFSNRSAL